MLTKKYQYDIIKTSRKEVRTVDEETRELLRDGIALLSLLINFLMYREQKRGSKKHKGTSKKRKK